VLGAMSLAGVFYYDEVPRFGQLQNPIHVGGLSVEIEQARPPKSFDQSDVKSAFP
jgi:hypothetical protein